MDEPGHHIAVPLDRSQVVDDQVVGALALAAVLLRGRDGENLEPDALEVDADDVLPGDDGHELIVFLDERELPSLEQGPGHVVEPRESARANPLLDVVLVDRTGRARESCKPSLITSRRAEGPEDQWERVAAVASRSRSAGVSRRGPPGTRSLRSAAGSNAARTQ